MVFIHVIHHYNLNIFYRLLQNAQISQLRVHANLPKYVQPVYFHSNESNI